MLIHLHFPEETESREEHGKMTGNLFRLKFAVLQKVTLEWQWIYELSKKTMLVKIFPDSDKKCGW